MPGHESKIVVLDGCALNPGDLDWSPLRAQGKCAIHDRTPPRLILERTAGAEIALTNKTPLVRDTIQSLTRLRYIGVLATGYNVVDVEAATERGIVVTNVPAYSTPSVAQLVFALLLELTHHTGHHSQAVHSGRWSASADFCFWDYPLIELAGRTFGLIGYGSIGQSVAPIARAFGMRILAHTRSSRSADGVEFVSLDELLRQADVVSLHCPLTPETKGLINTQRLALMKPGAYLINTGRGPLIVEKDLAEALNTGRIAGAGLDVLSIEPPPADNPLLGARNCIITPHFAWATQAARQRLLNAVVANIKAFLDGHPRNVVNGV